MEPVLVTDTGLSPLVRVMPALAIEMVRLMSVPLCLGGEHGVVLALWPGHFQTDVEERLTASVELRSGARGCRRYPRATNGRVLMGGVGPHFSPPPVPPIERSQPHCPCPTPLA